MPIDNVCACLCFSLIFPGVRLSSDAQFSDFLDGLGPAQLVGRQTLATPPMGQNPQTPLNSAFTVQLALQSVKWVFAFATYNL